MFHPLGSLRHKCFQLLQLTVSSSVKRLANPLRIDGLRTSALSRKGLMRLLVTGHHGYIGSVMVGVLAIAGHTVTGLDTFLYEGCTFGDEPAAIPEVRKDIRD